MGRCCFTGIILIVLALTFGVCLADWQSDLESKFDIVETFDNIDDWRGGTDYHYDTATMPKESGVTGKWGFYYNGSPAVDDWIKDHGEYKWGDSGKSLCINYNNFVGGIDGYGPARLGMYFGDGTPTSGYSTIYIFHMIKFRPGFFAKIENGDYAWVGTCKYLETNTGFSSIGQWGTTSENALACSQDQYRKEYGLNFNIMNLRGGGLSNPQKLFLLQQVNNANLPSTCWAYDHVEVEGKEHNSLLFQDEYEAGNWIGIEIKLTTGTVNSHDAETEIWFYKADGTLIGTTSMSNYMQIEEFDHKFNKIVFGGNRFGSDYDLDSGDSDENRFYIDDVIINGSRIGPTYFALMSGGSNSINREASGSNLINRLGLGTLSISRD